LSNASQAVSTTRAIRSVRPSASRISAPPQSLAFALAAEDLAASDYADACPIATIALEVASTNDHLRRATADVFTDWISRGAVLFARHGLGEPTARRLAIAMIAALEGAFVLARALRDPEPLHAAGASVATAVRQALDQAADSPLSVERISRRSWTAAQHAQRVSVRKGRKIARL
jgi:hypothetical protein